MPPKKVYNSKKETIQEKVSCAAAHIRTDKRLLALCWCVDVVYTLSSKSSLFAGVGGTQWWGICVMILREGEKKKGRRKSSVSQAAHHYTQHPVWTGRLCDPNIENRQQDINHLFDIIHTQRCLLKKLTISGKEKNLGSHIIRCIGENGWINAFYSTCIYINIYPGAWRLYTV